MTGLCLLQRSKRCIDRASRQDYLPVSGRTAPDRSVPFARSWAISNPVTKHICWGAAFQFWVVSLFNGFSANSLQWQMQSLGCVWTRTVKQFIWKTWKQIGFDSIAFFFSVVERIEQKLCKLMHFFQPALASEDIYESLEKQSPHRNCSFHCCPAWRCRRTVKYQMQVNEVLAASLKPFSELGPWNLIFWKISTKLACFLTGTKCFHTTCMNALPWDLRFSFWVSENILKPLISSFPCCLPILGEISYLSSSLSKMVWGPPVNLSYMRKTRTEVKETLVGLGVRRIQ